MLLSLHTGDLGMLAVSPVRNSTKDEREGEMESFSIGCDDFPEFSTGNFLECIDFDDLFVGINDGGHEFLDLEIDKKILDEFSISGGEESEMNSSVSVEKVEEISRKEEENKVSASPSGSWSFNQGDQEIVSKRDESVAANSSRKETDHKASRSKSSAHLKNFQRKRKVKVDWTPELHRRFVQAVEQLGVDKAVPSRILELMGIDCLTRHNIASHLQKYRSHRKHLLVREAEAASWSQRRQMHGGATGGSKRDVNPWLAPTMGFPPMTPALHHFRPLHVWGHPSADQSLMHMWPTPAWALTPPPPPPPPPRQAPDPQFWHSNYQRVANSLTPGTPYFRPPLATTRFPTPSVTNIFTPRTISKVEPGIAVPTGPYPPFDIHPSKESIDAAIGDVISKPWLPFPIGLKAPSVDSVLEELQQQGVPKVSSTA